MSFSLTSYTRGPRRPSYNEFQQNLEELTRREGSRQVSGKHKSKRAEGCSSDGSTPLSLSVAPWRSSGAAFPRREGFSRAFFAPGSKFDSFLTVPTPLKRPCDCFSNSSINLPWTPPSVNQLNRFKGILP